MLKTLREGFQSGVGAHYDNYGSSRPQKPPVCPGLYIASFGLFRLVAVATGGLRGQIFIYTTHTQLVVSAAGARLRPLSWTA